MHDTPVSNEVLPTAGQLTTDQTVEPHLIYREVQAAASLENSMTLVEACGATDPETAGYASLDAVPASVLSQQHTGIFPPATQAELDYLRVENKNATEAELLKVMLQSGSLTLADTKGYRTRTAYRLLRYMAFVRGILSGHDLLQVMLNVSPDDKGVDLWSMPIPLLESTWLTGNRAVRAVLSTIDRHADTYLFNTNQGLYNFSGNTTLPPPIPDKFFPRSPKENWKMRINRKTPTGYDVQQDRSLILYCEAMTLISESLNITAGAPEEPWAGHLGLAGLLNPHTARVAWPTRDELAMYEEEFMLKVWDKACHTTTRATETWLQQFFGYSRLEALDIAKTAISIGSVLYNEGLEDIRALEIKRLDSLEDKCELADDFRAILQVRRLKFNAVGLTYTDDQDGIKDIRDAAIAGIQQVHDAEENQ